MKKYKKRYFLFIIAICINIFSACGISDDATYWNQENELPDEDNRSYILNNDYTDEKRKQLLKEDIEFLRKELPRKHVNMYDNISWEEFNNQVVHLKNRVDRLENEEVFVEMDKIIAQIGDAHTHTDSFNLYKYRYPVLFYKFNDGIYVINADKSLEDILYSKVVEINGMDINYVTEQFKTLVSHENDSHVNAMVAQLLTFPIYMYGLSITSDYEEISVSFEKSDGEVVEKVIPSTTSDKVDLCISYEDDRSVYVYDKDKEEYYWYEYLPEHNTLYFKYNVCRDMDAIPFSRFNHNMFNQIKDLQTDKIVVDLRSNGGGSTNIIIPFLESLSDFISKNPETEIFIIAGRNTFSAGADCILDIKKVADNYGKSPAVLIGEPTGGSPNCYGEVLSFELPNSKIKVSYSTKYYKLTDDGALTITPDVELSPSVNDFKENKDVFMDYILKK